MGESGRQLELDYLLNNLMLLEEHDSYLMVDEAHATGIFGESGSGILEEKGLTGDCDIIMGTFGKALGLFGAYVASSQMIKHHLINSARSFIYSTSLPIPLINANILSLEISKKERFRREELIWNVKYWLLYLSIGHMPLLWCPNFPHTFQVVGM